MADEMSARHRLPFLATGQAQKELTHNEALALIDVAMSPAAVAAGVNSPPPSPVSGQCWIVGPAPTGSWTGQADAIACWTASGWRFLPAVEGMEVWLTDQQVFAVRRTGSWAAGEVRGTSVLIANQQVVGARLAAVAGPSGGAVVDAEARAAIAALIDRLATHGLIAV